MKQPFTIEPNGSKSWVSQSGDTYVVTGIDRDGRRFRRACATWGMANGINLWNGSKWLIRDGRRFLISRVQS